MASHLNSQTLVVMFLLPIHLRTTLRTLPHHRFLRTVPQQPEALGFHPRYQEITILDSTITTRMVDIQVSLLEPMHPLKVLQPLMHLPLGPHPRHTVHPLGPLRAGRPLLHSTHSPQVLLEIIHRRPDPLVAMVHVLPQ